MFMRSASEAINNALVICNYCFNKASEQDGDITCCIFLRLRCLHNVGEM